MNGKPDQLQRSPGDFILFALAFIGFVIASTGVITTSVPAAVAGLILLGLGISYFMLKGWQPQ